jgi:hypothetical protein
MGDVRIGHLVAGVGPRRRDDASDRQVELARELEVALVVRGHGHDRAGAVAGQHIVGGKDRDALAVDRVDRVGADRDAGLVAVRRQSVDLRASARLFDVGIDLGPPVGGRQLGDQRVLRGEHHERGPEQGVGSRREHADRGSARMMVGGRGLEVDVGALGATDPVRLLDADRLGPVDALE